MVVIFGQPGPGQDRGRRISTCRPLRFLRWTELQPLARAFFSSIGNRVAEIGECDAAIRAESAGGALWNLHCDVAVFDEASRWIGPSMTTTRCGFSMRHLSSGSNCFHSSMV